MKPLNPQSVGAAASRLGRGLCLCRVWQAVWEGHLKGPLSLPWGWHWQSALCVCPSQAPGSAGQQCPPHKCGNGSVTPPGLCPRLDRHATERVSGQLPRPPRIGDRPLGCNRTPFPVHTWKTPLLGHVALTRASLPLVSLAQWMP